MQPTATGSLSDCRTRMLRETPSEKHWSVNWNRCWLSQANKSLSSDLATLLPKVMIQGLWALWGSSCSAVKQENRELENGPDTAIRLCPLPKAASAPSHVSTGLSAAQNYQKSPLMNFFKTASIFCLHPISLFICNLSGSHTAKGCYFGCLACLFFFSAQWIRGCPRHCVVHGFVIFLAGYSPHCKVILCSSNCWAEGVLGHHFPSEQWVGLQLQKMSLSRALPAPDGNGFPSAKYSSGHYPRWCHFCGVPIFHTLAGKQTTRQFTAQALAGCHSSVFLPPCIKFNLQNLVFPPGTSPSHSCVWDHTLLSCWWCANSFSASCLSAFGVHHTWRRAGVRHGAWWMWWRITEKRITEKRSHSPRSQPPSSACPALFLHPPSLYPHIQAGFIHQFPC